MKKLTKVYGIRTCLSCKGIVRGKALRTKFRQRNRYFCNEKCVEHYLEPVFVITKRLQKHFPRTFKMLVKSLKKGTKEYIDKSLEPVFVITK